MTETHILTPDEAYQFHVSGPVRVYETDPAHADRIKFSRRILGSGLAEHFQHGIEHHRRARIIELGCGTGDIGGIFSWAHNVKGYEASTEAAILCARKWIWMDVKVADIQALDPHKADALIVTDVLEYLPDPAGLLNKWFPKVDLALVSSLLGGDDEDTRLWHFESGELEKMVFEAGHSILHSQNVEAGKQVEVILLTKRCE